MVEPLSQLYKDEVRELGEKLGLPHHLVWRHPFPGPGLAVRALCADGGPGEIIPETARAAARQLVERSGLDLEVEILPLRSVGVQGDGRTYAHPALLRRREGDAGLLPREAAGEGDAVSWDALEEISTELTNQIRAVNRVVVQLGPAARLRQRPVAGYLTRSRLDRLRLADQVVMEGLERHGLMEQVTQMPTVLVPLSSDGGAESLVLRPITTSDFMTARFDRLPAAFLRDVTARLLALGGIEAVYYDVTHKPPGTVEWE